MMLFVNKLVQPSKLIAQRGRRLALAALLATFAITSTGCTVFDSIGNNFKYNGVWNDAATKMRHRHLSSKSWHNRKHQHCNEGCLDDFCAGYRQGYEDVAGGGTGCTPNFPPRDYWGWQHQTAEGQKKVSAWFAGYPHGARAAEEEGIGNWSQIQMSSNLQSQYVRAGVFPNRGSAVYPITEPVKSPITPGSTGPVMEAPSSAMIDGSNQPHQSPVPMSNSIMSGSIPPNG